MTGSSTDWSASTSTASTAQPRAPPPGSPGIAGSLRRLQNGYVRSYALSLLGGAALVVLALLVVNI